MLFLLYLNLLFFDSLVFYVFAWRFVCVCFFDFVAKFPVLIVRKPFCFELLSLRTNCYVGNWVIPLNKSSLDRDFVFACFF